MLTAVLAAICGGLAAAGDAAMNPVRSRFTTIDLKTCQIAKRHRDGNGWRCRGLPGYPVAYAEGDQRAFVSFGLEAEKRQAARQTLTPFNTIFASSGRRATIEWRFRRIGGAAADSRRPHASRRGQSARRQRSRRGRDARQG